MKISIVSADNKNGGASRATKRIVKGLTQSSIQNKIFYEFICNGEPEIGYFQRKPIYKWYVNYLYKNCKIRPIAKTIINKLWQKLNLIELKKGYLFYRLGNSINYKKTFKNSDLIHIFWGQTFIDPVKIMSLNKPTIITLHDMWFITGGFAYTDNPENDKRTYLTWIGRKNYENQLAKKIKLLNCINTQIVVTSNWMANKVLEAGFKENKITKILNYIPRNFKFLNEREKCKELLGWSINAKSKKIIYFSGSLTDPRKGFNYLLELIKKLSDDTKSKIAVQILGHKFDKIQALDNLNIEYNCLGIFSDELSQIIAYNSSDILICPSNIDNSPNVIAEALMCGLPCVALEGTGASEMIEIGLSGFVTSKNNIHDLANFISDFAIDKFQFDNLQISESARKKYSIDNTCNKYLELYKSIL